MPEITISLFEAPPVAHNCDTNTFYISQSGKTNNTDIPTDEVVSRTPIRYSPRDIPHSPLKIVWDGLGLGEGGPQRTGRGDVREVQCDRGLHRETPHVGNSEKSSKEASSVLACEQRCTGLGVKNSPRRFSSPTRVMLRISPGRGGRPVGGGRGRLPSTKHASA